MKRFIFLSFCLVGMAGAPALRADQPPAPAPAQPTEPAFNLDKDVYVVLYQKKVELSTAGVEREKAQHEFLLSKLRTVEKLRATGAAAREEYDEARTAADVQRTKVEEAAIRVDTSRAMLAVVRFRRAAGKEIPVFQDP